MSNEHHNTIWKGVIPNIMVSMHIKKPYIGKIQYAEKTFCGIWSYTVKRITHKPNKISKQRIVRNKVTYQHKAWRDTYTTIFLNNEHVDVIPDVEEEFWDNLIMEYETDMIHEMVHVIKNRVVHSNRFYRDEFKIAKRYAYNKYLMCVAKYAPSDIGLLSYDEFFKMFGDRMKLTEYYNRARRYARKIRDIRNMAYMGGADILHPKSKKDRLHKHITNGDLKIAEGICKR